MASVPMKRHVHSPVMPKRAVGMDTGTDSRVPVTRKNPGQGPKPKGVPPGPRAGTSGPPMPKP